jgi:DNA-directed RNA polymerase specialized sigma24 family protein
MAERSTGARQSDEEILAALDAAPDAFAVFYRRHVAELLRDLVGRTNNAPLAADLCAETFAAALDGAHRFDPSHGSAAAWLFQIAEREIAHAERIGAPRDRARRRLGLAPLQPGRDALAVLDPGPASGGGFVSDLEEELVAAARFRAQRRASRLEPSPPRSCCAAARATPGPASAAQRRCRRARRSGCCRCRRSCRARSPRAKSSATRERSTGSRC